MMMDKSYPTFPIGSVGYNLMLMRGTWHDHVETYHLNGEPLADDAKAGIAYSLNLLTLSYQLKSRYAYPKPNWKIFMVRRKALIKS